MPSLRGPSIKSGNPPPQETDMLQRLAQCLADLLHAVLLWLMPTEEE